jgi:hypothetical protein
MRFNIFGRFEMEVLRDGGTWKAFNVGEGKRVHMNDVVIPAHVEEEELETYLDDLFHELAKPGGTIRRVG